MHGATHAFEAAASGTASLPDLPAGTVSPTQGAEITLLPAPLQQFSERILVMDPLTGQPSSVPYKMILNAAVAASGKLDGSGLSTRPIKDDVEDMVAVAGPSGEWSIEYRSDEADADVQPAHDGTELMA